MLALVTVLSFFGCSDDDNVFDSDAGYLPGGAPEGDVPRDVSDARSTIETGTTDSAEPISFLDLSNRRWLFEVERRATNPKAGSPGANIPESSYLPLSEPRKVHFEFVDGFRTLLMWNAAIKMTPEQILPEGESIAILEPREMTKAGEIVFYSPSKEFLLFRIAIGRKSEGFVVDLREISNGTPVKVSELGHLKAALNGDEWPHRRDAGFVAPSSDSGVRDGS